MAPRPPAAPRRFSGPLPVSAALQQLVIIRASNNFFSGPLPHGLYDMRRLQVLQFDHNAISGNISRRIGQLDKLAILVAGGNQLSGLPPELFLISSLFRAELQSNRLTGPLPATVVAARALRVLLLQDNPGLTGSLNKATLVLQSTLQATRIEGTRKRLHF